MAEVRYKPLWLPIQELLESEQLKPGDLLEFQRVRFGILRYSHWAVYIGEDGGVPCVIHLSDANGDFGCEETQDDQTKINQTLGSLNALPVPFSGGGANARVRIDRLSKVAGEDLLRINNSLDKDHSSLDREEIVERAKAKVGGLLGNGGYNILKNNCEHFANHCRYDQDKSGQVETVGTTIKVVGALALVGTAIYGIFSIMGEKKERIQERNV